MKPMYARSVHDLVREAPADTWIVLVRSDMGGAAHRALGTIVADLI